MVFLCVNSIFSTSYASKIFWLFLICFHHKQCFSGPSYSKVFFFFFFSFQDCTCSIWKFPDQGSNQSCSFQPATQPQQCGIWASSLTCTTAHSKARSQWAGPGIEPASSWILVGFVTAKAQWELLSLGLSTSLSVGKFLELGCIESKWQIAFFS